MVSLPIPCVALLLASIVVILAHHKDDWLLGFFKFFKISACIILGGRVLLPAVHMCVCACVHMLLCIFNCVHECMYISSFRKQTFEAPQPPHPSSYPCQAVACATRLSCMFVFHSFFYRLWSFPCSFSFCLLLMFSWNKEMLTNLSSSAAQLLWRVITNWILSRSGWLFF